MLKLGNRIEPMIDYTFIESLDKAGLLLNHPTKREKCILFEKPWERYAGLVDTVMYDGTKYRCITEAALM